MSGPPYGGQPYPQQPGGQRPQSAQPYGQPGPPPQWQQPPNQSWQQPQWQQPTHEHGGYDLSEAEELPLAPIYRRGAARLMDNALVAVFGFALILPLSVGALGLGQTANKTKDEGGVWNWPIIFALFAVLALLPFLYEAVQLSAWGATLGKRVMRLSVVRVDPAGDPLPATQAIWRAGITHIGYQVGFFLFLSLTTMVWDYFAYGLILVTIGTLMAYLWAIWDEPLHQALHDRFAGTIVVDDRAELDGEYEEEE